MHPLQTPPRGHPQGREVRDLTRHATHSGDKLARHPILLNLPDITSLILIPPLPPQPLPLHLPTLLLHLLPDLPRRTPPHRQLHCRLSRPHGVSDRKWVWPWVGRYWAANLARLYIGYFIHFLSSAVQLSSRGPGAGAV